MKIAFQKKKKKYTTGFFPGQIQGFGVISPALLEKASSGRRPGCAPE